MALCADSGMGSYDTDKPSINQCATLPRLLTIRLDLHSFNNQRVAGAEFYFVSEPKMTAISLISPYAPQPATGTGTDPAIPLVSVAAPVPSMSNSADAGLASDQSGQGSGNGTGTGGAYLDSLLKRGRDDMQIQQPSPKSVVEAQSNSDPATVFLAQQAEKAADAKATEAARAEEDARAAREVLKEAEKPEFKLPNPLPTAPILQREES